MFIFNIMNQKKINSDFHRLLLRDQKALIAKHRNDIKAIIKAEVSDQQLLEWKKFHHQQKQQILKKLMQKVRNTIWAQETAQKVKNKILTTAHEMYEFDSQVNYFLAECLRQSLNPPTATSQSEQTINFQPFYRFRLNKEVRRVMWQKCLVNEETKQTYFKFDHEICPYNLKNELSINLIRSSQLNGLTLKENQKDVALRLLQYIVKKHNKIPNTSQQCLCLCIADLYSHLTPSKIHVLGAIYVGLLQLANTYYEPDVDLRLKELMSVFEIVDKESFELIKTKFLNEEKHMAILNECYEHFRLSLGTIYFPFSGCQFMIDQLLIKKQNKLDLYVFFTIMIMIMSDELQLQQNERKLLTQVVYSERTKAIIKLEDIIDAFKVIYQKIPVFSLGMKGIERNQLLEEMMKYDTTELEEEEQPEMTDGEVNEFLVHDKRQLNLSNFMDKV